MTSPMNAARHIVAVDLSLCHLLNRASTSRHIRSFFVVISRLGDGVFWYTLMAVWPVYGVPGFIASLHMALVGLTGVTIYRFIKRRVVRERPFVTHASIRLGTRPLDRYSFPSGHTLHAVGFAFVAVGHFPWVVWITAPFALLVAVSRVVLGLHYPSDVLTGALLGAGIATASFWLL